MRQQEGTIVKKEEIIYVDNRGWKYQVMPGLGVGTYKARYQKPGSQRWTCCPRFPWRGTPEEAEADLKLTARKKKWVRCCRVSREALDHIIEERKPEGMYFTLEGSVWVAVDNSTGDALTEDFLDLEEALQWLAEPCREGYL